MASLPATHPILGTSADDNIAGTRRSDVIAGQSGNDTITGQTGHDELWGGQGHDELYGNSGDDRIYGSGGPTIINVSTIPIGNDYPVRVIFEGETAGYRNSFGYYKIDSTTKEIYDVDIIWPNASLQGSGGDLVAGQSDALLDVQAGDNIGFFIVSNGFSYNDFAALGEGSYAFQNANGTPATLESQDPKLVFVAEGGETTEIVYHQYHTAAYDETLGLNPDALLHTSGILKTDKGTLTIGFEDLLNGGDLDFDDSVFTIDLGPANAVVLNAHYRQEHGLPDIVENGDGNGEPIIVIEDDDILRGGTGDDELWGHKGNDLLYGDNGTDEMHGGSGDDILHGGSGNDEMYGNVGNDFIYGDSGSDYIVGGSGDDYIEGGNYNDSLVGGSGSDTLKGGSHNDDLAGNSGDDVLYGENGNDLLQGGSGDDTLDGGASQDTLQGGSGNDLLVGGSGTDSLFGHSGNDVLDGGSGSDLLDGGSGIDTADYSDWSKKISVDMNAGTVKGNGTDIIVSIENIFATDYDDKIIGDHRENEIHAGNGADRVSGYAGDDVLYGGNGEDYLNGASGADILFGEADDDLLRGGKGSDEITGGAGNDELWGGENGVNDHTADTFFFDVGSGSDSIADFEAGVDIIALSDLLIDESDDVLSALSDSSEGAVLDLSAFNGEAGDSILFTGVTVEDLTDETWHVVV